MSNKQTNALVICTQWFAPAYEAGGPVVSLLRLAEALAPDVPVYVIAGLKQPSGALAPEDKELERRLHQQNITVYRGSGFRFVLRTLRALWRKPHQYTWYYNDIFMPVWFLWPRFLLACSGRSGELQVLAMRGMLLPGALAVKPKKKQVYLAVLRVFLYWFPVEFHATSVVEKKEGQRRLTMPFAHVVPNMPPLLDRLPTMKVKTKGELSIACVGRIHPIKNLQWVLDWVGHLDAQQQQGIAIHFFGHVEDRKYEQTLRQRAAMLPNVKTDFHGGFSPKELPAVYQQFHLLCCPSHSENYGQAIAQALAWGIPVAASKNTPWKGLAAAGAGCILDPDHPEASHAALEHFVAMDAAAWEKQHKAVLRYAQNELNGDAIFTDYNAMFALDIQLGYRFRRGVRSLKHLEE